MLIRRSRSIYYWRAVPKNLEIRKKKEGALRFPKKTRLNLWRKAYYREIRKWKVKALRLKYKTITYHWEILKRKLRTLRLSLKTVGWPWEIRKRKVRALRFKYVISFCSKNKRRLPKC